EFCRSSLRGEDQRVLDIGAGYGAATLAALRAGARVIANDLAGEHLEEILIRVPDNDRPRLACTTGRFPRGLHFEQGTLGAVHASSVFHFLTGRQLEEGLRAIARWLRPGGKLFLQAATPYQAAFAPFIPAFERRIAAGEKWPGWVAKVSEYSSHRQRSQMPRAIHLLDDRILRSAAEDAGLTVERAWLYQRADLPATLRLDGREAVGLVARKPDQ
ncbi:MAG: class I SAM-dependent methyltransferase, partial [Acidobacteria bacterium]|nr:class I SAM-dependent methyltransferase [Acidobacteriota bacterium]